MDALIPTHLDDAPPASEADYAAPRPNRHPKAKPPSNGDDLFTEASVADAFRDIVVDHLRFDHTAKRWFKWDGIRWARQDTHLAYSWASRKARAMAKDTGSVKAEMSAGRAAFAGGVETLAQRDPALAVTFEVWDRDPWLLGTPGGVVDLRTGIMRPAERDNYITKLTGCVPAEPGTPHPLWSRFLSEATAGDVGLQRFLCQIAGYCLTGTTTEHALFFVHGPGGNGKSLFLNIVGAMLGGYATTAAMDTFTASQSDRHPTDLAKLNGPRMVAASETEEGRAWAESRIMALTGGDQISARFMRQDFFEFTPQFKLVIVGNHKPVLQNVNDAAKRRFNIIPFLHKPAKPDFDLEAKLKAELPAILRWALDGCLDWQANGLIRPAVVTDATAEYFSEQDTVSQWVSECCDMGGRNLSETTATLFKSWTKYAEDNGEKPRTTKWLSQVLARLGAEPVKDTPGHRGKRGFLRIAVKLVDTSGWQGRYGGDE